MKREEIKIFFLISLALHMQWNLWSLRKSKKKQAILFFFIRIVALILLDTPIDLSYLVDDPTIYTVEKNRYTHTQKEKKVKIARNELICYRFRE